MQRAYEFMIILDGDLEDTAAQAWVKSVTDSITKAGGTVHGKPDWWGRRQYAYPINKKEHGYYAVFNVLAPGWRTRRVRASAPSRGRCRPPQAPPPSRCRGRAPRHGGRHRGLIRPPYLIEENTMADSTVTITGTLTRDPRIAVHAGRPRRRHASASPSTTATSGTTNGSKKPPSST